MAAQNQNEHLRQWNLSLYIAGEQARSRAAYANIKRICEEYLPGMYSLELVDITEAPEAAVSGQILAVPTLVRKEPKPERRIIGDLADLDTVLVSLGVRNGRVPAA
jgi:circadian clock protein KaiB